MKFKAKIIKQGNSRVIIIPKKIRKALRIDYGDKINIVIEKEGEE